MRDALRKGDSGRFVTLLKAYLSGIPSRLRTHIGQYENYYHTVFYCILSLIGLDIDVEYNTSEGFIDAVVRTPPLCLGIGFSKATGTVSSCLIE